MEVAVRKAEALGLDGDAFREFYEDALPRVHGYFVHRCGGSVSVAEDLTQETFIASVDELKKGRRVETPVPWIYGIARHKLLDHYRKQAKSERLVDPVAEIGDLVVDASAEQTRERTTEALAAVPATQRAVLVLCYMDGFSAAEIAAELGKSVAAVHSLLERGRAHFKHAYLEGLA